MAEGILFLKKNQPTLLAAPSAVFNANFGEAKYYKWLNDNIFTTKGKIMARKNEEFEDSENEADESGEEFQEEFSEEE